MGDVGGLRDNFAYGVPSVLWQPHKSPSGMEAPKACVAACAGTPPADQGGGKGLAQPARGLVSPACILEVAAVNFPLRRLGWPSLKVQTQGYVSLGPVDYGA